jgi:putative chitinase
MLLTLEEFQRAIPCSLQTASRWHPYIEKAMQDWHINTKKRAAGFIAQMAHESAKFTTFEENLSYSANGLARTWPSRYAVDKTAKVKVPNALALKIAYKPEFIANHTYANRFGNGDFLSGDGWRYRGRGPKQITFKANYIECGTALKLDLLNDPGMLMEPRYGAQSAAWYWSSRKCNEWIDLDDFEKCTKLINGGLIGHEDGNQVGLDDRVELWLNCKNVFGVA